MFASLSPEINETYRGSHVPLCLTDETQGIRGNVVFCDLSGLCWRCIRVWCKHERLREDAGVAFDVVARGIGGVRRGTLAVGDDARYSHQERRRLAAWNTHQMRHATIL